MTSTLPNLIYYSQSGNISSTEIKKHNDIAVIFHLFHKEYFEEFSSYLRNLEGFDLYISMPLSNLIIKKSIFASFPDARILLSENRGRDILPFITIINSIHQLNYKYILKLQTKKSPHREDGDIWRTDILEKIIGSTQITNSILNAFETDELLGFIGPKGHIIDYSTYIGGNRKKTEELSERASIKIKSDYSYSFIAGSMFWAKQQALKSVLDINIKREEFEVEPIGFDGALVHAIERFIGIAAEESGYKMFEVDENGKIYNPKKDPLDRTYQFGELNKTIVNSSNTFGSNNTNTLASIIKKGKSRFRRLRYWIDKSLKVGRDDGWLILGKKIKRKVPQLMIRVFHRTPDNNFINYDSVSQISPLNLLTSSKLIQLLNVNNINQARYAISLSHDNFIDRVGGVQINIYDELTKSNLEGINYLHIYPYYFNPNLMINNYPFFVGLSWNGKKLGVTNGIELFLALNQLSSLKLTKIIIHHLMGFNLEFVKMLLNEFGNNQGRFWIHDHFSICPSFYLLRNDIENCNAPDLNSNACMICRYVDARKVHREAMQSLFADNKFEVIAPSNYALNIWKDNFFPRGLPGTVFPHAKVIWTESLPKSDFNHSIRIAFVGFPVYHKGWETWLSLTSKYSKNTRFKFFLFSNRAGKSGNYSRVKTTVTNRDRDAMVNNLKSNHIDVVVLWSICPETFSFTLYESLAAGCYIITNKNSGNIKDYILANPRKGIVLDNDEQLYEFLLKEDFRVRLERFQENGKPQGKLVFMTMGVSK